jgi:hypothetical protein
VCQRARRTRPCADEVEKGEVCCGVARRLRPRGTLRQRLSIVTVLSSARNDGSCGGPRRNAKRASSP